MSQFLLIGPSTRAMAYSARRAGCDPLCIDLFADTDLQAIAPVERIAINDYPLGFINLLKKYPPDIPVLYTGGLENHPALYLELSKQRPVWGYLHPDPLHGNSVRNQEYLNSIAKTHAIRRPLHHWPCGFSGRRLMKPRAGAGGKGIRFWDGNPVPPTHYLEQYLEGPSLSAAFVRIDKITRLLGITQQLIGCEFLHAPSPFTYCGNIAPFPESLLRASAPLRGQEQTLINIALAITQADPHLIGLFGIDFILHKNDLYLLEVNPRYTASVELLEHTTGQSALDLHCQAFGQPSRSTQNQKANSPVVQTFLSVQAKAIYFAPHHFTFPHEGPWTNTQTTELWSLPTYADLPTPGAIIEKGQPVLTFFVQGKDNEEVVTNLQKRSFELDQLFQH